MRTRHLINVHVYDDTEGKDKLFGLDDDKAEVKLDGFQRQASGRFEIAVASDENLSFGDVQDVRFVYVKADNDFEVIFNGGVEPVVVKRGSAATTATARFAGELDVTAVNIANPSATVVLKGIYCFYGDPA